jgi:hypothetical protein
MQSSAAFGSKAGYNQSGGDYYIILSTIGMDAVNVFTPGTGSGGATLQGTLTAGTVANLGAGNGNFSVNNFGQYKVLRDMGKTVVSAGRTFRKFQSAVAQSLSTGGVTGGISGVTGSGYLTAYLEVAREGAAVPSVLIAPMM